MIRAVVSGEDVALVGAPQGALVYVDRDWLPDSSGPTPSLVVSSEGDVTWSDGRRARLQSSLAPDEAAARAFVSLARSAATEVAGLPPESVDVVGSGVVAKLVRSLVGPIPAASSERPRGIVDTTGDPAAIVDATRRVADLGTVVLAGEANGRRTAMNLYPDVHARGLRLVGVPPPESGHGASEQDVSDESLLTICRESLVHARPNEALTPGGAWYRVSA